MTLPHVGEPITEDDSTIAAYLEDVSIPTLLVSMVHLTGDPSWIRSELKPQGLFLNEIQGFMSEEDKAEARRRALPASSRSAMAGACCHRRRMRSSCAR